MALKQQIRTYSSFGGLRQDIAEANNGPENALIAKNCRFLISDEVRHRDGFGYFNNTQPSSDPMDESPVLGLHHFKYGGNSQLIVALDEYLFIDDGTTEHSSITPLKSGLDSTNYYSFCTLNNQCYIVNNSDDNMKYDGADVTNMCIEALDTSSVTVTASGSGSGLSTGDYYYLITYYNSTTFQESNPYSIEDLSVSVTSGQNITISNIPYSQDEQVDKVNIYRTTVNGSPYDAQFVKSVDNDETTPGSGVIADVDDDKADTNLENQIQLFHSCAPTFKKIVTHKNKIFGFVENSTVLYYSYDFNGWYFPQGEFGGLDFRVEINKDDGDYIKNIVSYIDGLIIFKENSIWILEGYDETDFFLRKLDYNENIGCVSHRGALVVNNLCYFVDKKGIFVTNANGFKYISAPVQSFLNNKNLIYGEAIDRTEVENVAIGVDTYNNNKVIKFSFTPIEGDYNTVHLVYDYELDKWSTDDGYSAQTYCKYEDSNIEYLLRGDDKGYIYLESVNSYDGAYYSSTSTSVGDSTLVDTNQTTWTRDCFKNLYIIILEGVYQGTKKRITSVNETTSTITIDGTWSGSADDAGIDNDNIKYIVGTNEFLYLSGWDDYGNPGVTKRLKYVRPRVKSSGKADIDIYSLYDFNLLLNVVRQITLEPDLVYGSDSLIWDVSYWGVVKIEDILRRTESSKIHTYNSYGIRSYDINSQIVVNNYDKIYQLKGLGIR